MDREILTMISNILLAHEFPVTSFLRLLSLTYVQGCLSISWDVNPSILSSIFFPFHMFEVICSFGHVLQHWVEGCSCALSGHSARAESPVSLDQQQEAGPAPVPWGSAPLHKRKASESLLEKGFKV